jgi:hypothetical protein
MAFHYFAAANADRMLTVSEWSTVVALDETLQYF